MASFDLSYVSPQDPFWKRWLMRAIENLSGRRSMLPVYMRWRKEFAGKSPTMMRDLLGLIKSDLDIRTEAWPITVPSDTPVVIVANHPFGIGDGIALLAIAEDLKRPYRILINADFMRVPEIRASGLPIDFSETRAAIETNIHSRNEARRLLKEGVTIVVFPAGGVATADNWRGRAEELPWKTFTARLIQQAQASVLPVYFEGQNSRLFHFVSRYSLALRLSLLVSEVRNFIGKPVKVYVGALTPFAAFANNRDRRAMTEELYVMVQRLAPGATNKPVEALKPTPPHLRRRYPWDQPITDKTTADYSSPSHATGNSTSGSQQMKPS